MTLTSRAVGAIDPEHQEQISHVHFACASFNHTAGPISKFWAKVNRRRTPSPSRSTRIAMCPGRSKSYAPASVRTAKYLNKMRLLSERLLYI